MIDSAEWCGEFIAALENNQNTAQYGLLDEDGQWRNQGGKVVTSAGGQGVAMLLNLREQAVTRFVYYRWCWKDDERDAWGRCPRARYRRVLTIN